MSDPSGRDLVSGDVGVLVEPDEMPTRSLGILAAVLTVVVVGLIFGAMTFFDATVQSEMEKKGYAGSAPISADQGGAATWKD